MFQTTAFFGGAPGGGEILIIFAVLLMLFGAKKVPGLARSIGQMLEELRRTTRDVTRELMHADEDEIKTSPPPYDDGQEQDTRKARDMDQTGEEPKVG